MKTVVVVGDPINGITIYGPFKDAEDAISWAQSEVTKEPWWTAALETP